MNINHERQRFEAQKLYPEKSLAVGYVLLFCLCPFGAHRFYYKRTGSAVLQLLLFLAIVPTLGLSAIVLIVWWIADICLLPGINSDYNNWCKEKQLNYLEAVSKGDN